MGVRYSNEFFESVMDASYVSAKTVMPHVISLCQPASIADFGCGVGSWLLACLECDVSDITGIDGDYVDENLLMIPKDRFVKADLTRPIDLKRRYDLVLSLEVAEHLPEQAAGTFIDTLTRHGSVVLFSAAVPGQAGEHHVNEQWADYWSAAFAKRGYTCIDCLRDIFWDNPRIDWWYRQNMLIFVEKDALSKYPRLVEEISRPRVAPLALAHPGFLDAISRRDPGLRSLSRQFPGAARATLKRAARMISPSKSPRK